MRETFVTLATGLMGIGKSYITEQMVRAYAKAHPKRSILIFDPNFEESWNKFPAIHFDIMEIQRAKKEEAKKGIRIVTQSEKNLKKLPPGIFIIAPFTIYKEPMNQPQMLLTMVTICTNYRGGMCLLEDVNKYTISFEKTEIQSAFKAIRHSSVDYIIHLQSLNPIRPVIFEATRLIRMHYDGFDLYKIKEKISQYFTICRIAQIIINSKYRKGEEITRKYPNWEQNPKLKQVVNAYKRLFIWVFTKDEYITGVKKDDFILACNEYLTESPSEYKPQLQKILFLQNRKSPTLNDHNEARANWIREHWRYFR